VYLDFVTPVICSQCQVNAIYFDLSSISDLVLHALLLHNLASYRLSTGYVNLFQSYLMNRLSCVHYSGALSSPLEILFEIPQGSVFGPLLFNIFINDLSNVIKISNYLLIADDIKIFWALKFPQDCSLLHMDTDAIYGWGTANHMQLNVSKTRAISFTRKTNMIAFEYKLCGSHIICTDTIKDLGVLLGSKLYFDQNVDHIFSQASYSCCNLHLFIY
jgi:hypothetical protein